MGRFSRPSPLRIGPVPTSRSDRMEPPPRPAAGRKPREKGPLGGRDLARVCWGASAARRPHAVSGRGGAEASLSRFPSLSSSSLRAGRGAFRKPRGPLLCRWEGRTENFVHLPPLTPVTEVRRCRVSLAAEAWLGPLPWPGLCLVQRLLSDIGRCLVSFSD